MPRRSVLLTAAVAVALLIPAVVYGSHQFTDVPESHTFHNDIDWLADNGITRGCGGTEFCPEENVTRGQMAAFMKRFHDRFIPSLDTRTIGLGYATRSQSVTPHTGNGVVDGTSLSLNIPEGGALVVRASADVFADTVDALSCGINVGGSPGTALPDSWRSIDLTTDWFETCSTSSAVPVGPGSMTVRLVISGANTETQVGAANLTAVLYTDSGFFGLLGEISQVEAPDLPDEPKGG